MQKYVCVCLDCRVWKAPTTIQCLLNTHPFSEVRILVSPFLLSAINIFIYLFIFPRNLAAHWQEVYRHITWTTRYPRVTFRLTPGPFCERLNSSSRFEKHVFYKKERVGVHGRVRWCLFSRKCLIQDQMWKSAHTRLPHEHIRRTYLCSWSIHLHEAFINAVSALSHSSYAL